MKFTLERGKNKSSVYQLAGAQSAVLFGFEADVTNLNIVFEDNTGTLIRYEIKPTNVGFAIDNISSCKAVWFEYENIGPERDVELMID